MPYTHIHGFYALLSVIFACFLGYMFLYGRRSRDRQTKLERQGEIPSSKDAGILEAQESLKYERRHHDKKHG